MRFFFYDRILKMEIGKHALAAKVVALSDEYFADHYARRAVMPLTLLVECLAQLAGWLNVASNGFNVTTVLCLVEGVKAYRPVVPGDTLKLEVWMLYAHSDGVTVRAEARVESEVVVTVERIVLANKFANDSEHVRSERERFRYLSGGYPLAEE
jgi:3-hydroxyacyl-[acyl-carrier-protein] dehydratase